MRVVVLGATGNVGTSLLGALETDPDVTSIVGVARRKPDLSLEKVTWIAADIARDDLAQHFRSADAVVHLAWAIQPSHDLKLVERINVEGSRRVFRAVADAGVPTLVYASSVGAYSPGPKDRLVDESWPTGGVVTSFYSRHKAQVERMLDGFEDEHPRTRVVRMRPGLIFKREAASGIRRLFAGPFLPTSMLKKSLIPFVPYARDLRFQAVHSLDAGEAYRLAVTSDARGAFNLASDPILDGNELARILDARPTRVSKKVLRGGTALTWRLHLQPTPPGWVDMAFSAPLLDSSRARRELGWVPRYTSSEALLELLAGMREKAGLDTPPLAPGAGGPARVKELLTGVGRKTG